MVLADWQVGQVVWTMLWLSMFAVSIWLVIYMFADVFTTRDLSGWAKAAWTLFFLFVPILGVVAYLCMRGSHLIGRAVDKQQADVAARRANDRRLIRSG
jgi:hypothetical protein